MTGYGSGAAYKETGILSSSPEQLIPLMYKHLVVNLKRGGHFIANGDIEGKYESLGRASDIVAELVSSLDFETGGELAPRLASLYAFWSSEISAAGRDLDAGRLARVTGMVESLHESWEEAVRSMETGAAGLGTA